MAASISTPRGITVTRPLQLKTKQGITNPYTGTEPLSAQVWRGGGQPVLFNPTVTWDNPAQGRILVTCLGTDTQNLESGTYPVLLTVAGVPVVDTDGEPIVVLVLGDAPGTDAPLTSYCTVQDMYDYFSDLNLIQDDRDQTGFARQRQKARQWTDRVIQANRRNTSCTQLGFAGRQIYGCSWFGWPNNQQSDPTLQGYLDGNKLMLTSQVVEMNARMALAYACEGEIGPGEEATQWQKLAARNRAEAESIACKLLAQIDLNNDGYPEITINCGMASNR